MSGAAMARAPWMRGMWEKIERIYELNKHKKVLSPMWFANEAMKLEKFSVNDHAEVYWGCHHTFREMARMYFRQKLDPIHNTEDDDGQLTLFSGVLQKHYPVPVAPGEEGYYVAVEDLTPEQIAFNVHRLRKTGRSYLAHADALAALVTHGVVGIVA